MWDGHLGTPLGRPFRGSRPWTPTGRHLECPGSSFWLPTELICGRLGADFEGYAGFGEPYCTTARRKNFCMEFHTKVWEEMLWPPLLVGASNKLFGGYQHKSFACDSFACDDARDMPWPNAWPGPIDGDARGKNSILVLWRKDFSVDFHTNVFA